MLYLSSDENCADNKLLLAEKAGIWLVGKAVDDDKLIFSVILHTTGFH